MSAFPTLRFAYHAAFGLLVREFLGNGRKGFLYFLANVFGWLAQFGKIVAQFLTEIFLRLFGVRLLTFGHVSFLDDYAYGGRLSVSGGKITDFVFFLEPLTKNKMAPTTKMIPTIAPTDIVFS